MHQEQKEFTPEDSLRLIKEMIDTTRNSISDSSHYFLLWGYAVLLSCSLQYILAFVVHYPKSYYAWGITWLAAILHIFFIRRDMRNEKATTFIGAANGYLWTALGLGFGAVAIIFSKIGWQHSMPFYILFYAIGTSVSGKLIKFTPLVIGGGISYILAIATAFVKYDVQLLLVGISILISYIIPGHLLRAQHNKSNN